MNKKVFNIMFIMLFAIFAICIPSAKVRADTSSDNKWVYDKATDSNGAYAIITNYTGNTTVASITIPDNIDGIAVKSIKGHFDSETQAYLSPFSNCTNLENVNIPVSITSIGSYAFYYCRKIRSITIPNSVTSIDDHAFYYCDYINSINIPDSVTSIGEYAFCYCLYASSITISNSVTRIGDHAFYYCSNVSSITIPNSVTSIENHVFCYCLSLRSITIPNSVTSIGDAAFRLCRRLSNITISNSSAVLNGPDIFSNTAEGLTITTFSNSNGNNVQTYALNHNNIPCNVQTPSPDATVEASALALTPEAGADNEITLKVKDSAGNMDSTFSGAKAVTISGVKPAPYGSHGNITYNDGAVEHSNEELTSDSETTTGQAISLYFASGQATCKLRLDDAENQSIEFNVAGVTTPAATILKIQPQSGTVDGIKVITQPVPGAVTADLFSVQPAAVLADKFGNTCITATASASVTASAKAGTGSWTLGGTVTKTAQGEKITFTDLTCSILTAGNGAITFTSGAMTADSNSFTIPLKRAKTLTANTTDNDVDHNIEITFPPDSSFENVVTSVSFNGNTLTSNQYTVDSGKITLYPDNTDNNYLSNPATGDIVIKATNYNDSIVQQTIRGSSKCDVTEVTAPANSTISGTDITAAVNSGSAITIAVTTSKNSIWKLYSDDSCTNEIPSKIMSLNPGSNKAYIKVTAQNTSSTETYTITINVPNASNVPASPTGLAGVAPTTIGAADGKITGTTTDMEYKLSSDSTYVGCTGTEIDGLLPGSYSVRVKSVGGNTASAAVTVTVPASHVAADTEKPVIHLNGSSLVNLTYGATYTDQGAAASDNVDGDITAGIVKTITNSSGTTISAINTSQPETYTIHYNVSDAAGNVADEITRTVIVQAYVPPYTPPYIPPTPQPIIENRQASIIVGKGEASVQVTVERITYTDGIKKDTIVFDENTTEKIIKETLQEKTTFAAIYITDASVNSADIMDIKFPKASSEKLPSNGAALSLKTEKAAFYLTPETLVKLKGKDVEITISKEKDSSEIGNTKALILKLASGGQIISDTLKIEANYTGRTKITIPIDPSKLPKEKEELNKFLNSLAVMVHHSDGEDVVDKGTIVYDEKGNVIGIAIYVDKFSNFTLIEIPKDYFQGKTTIMKDKVAVDKEWQIKFTKPADAATVTKDNVYVVDSKGSKVEIKVSYGSDDILKVAPVNSYTLGETYYLYITKAVKAKDRTPLVNELRYQFTVK